MGNRVLFVQSSKTGPNAVDMLLAFCLGEAYQVDKVANQPARYVVVSKDKDFDALTLHMKHIGMNFQRVPSLPKALALLQAEGRAAPKEAPGPVRSASPAASGKLADVERVIEDLRRNVRTRPKRRSTLEHKIESILGGRAAAARVGVTVSELERRGVIGFDGAKVVYDFR
jgi:hypothetical protein